MEEQKNNAPGTPPDEKLAQCGKERDEYLAGWQRAKADFINYRREELQRFEEVIRSANEELLRDLIGVLDNFDLGLAALEKSGPVEKGVYMIRAQMEDLFTRHGLRRIPLKPGDPFDPAIAEAIAEAESDAPAGTVLEEIEPGYRLHERVIRPARVKISRALAKNE